MKRPDRYPYSKKQWIERTVDYYRYDGELYFSQRTLENRITGEIKNEEVEGWKKLLWLRCQMRN